MLRLVNDPKAADLRVGDVIAYRTHVGVVFPWVDGMTVAELVEFLGDAELVEVGGGLYRRGPEGELWPIEVKAGMVFVRPPAGDWFVADNLSTLYARVVEVPDVDPPKVKVVSEWVPTVATSWSEVATTVVVPRDETGVAAQRAEVTELAEANVRDLERLSAATKPKKSPAKKAAPKVGGDG